MTATLRVCFWTSGFQADTHALAQYLGTQPDFEVTVAMERPAQWAGEAVNRFLPVRARFVDREDRAAVRAAAGGGFDLLVVDNHLPGDRLALRIFVLWHGFGWRIDELDTMRKELRSLVGDVTVPNPRFRWQAFGEWDRRYRIEHSRLAPDNVVSLGSAYSDLLLPAAERSGSPIDTPDIPDRQTLAALARDAYPVDVARKNVLLGLTWHHGNALGHWGDERELLARLFARVEERGANVLVRMHDRHRYEPAYLAALERSARAAGNVSLSYKSERRDSLVDFLLADALVSNYSSLLNPFYCTRKPTIHLDPREPGQTDHVYRRWKRGKLRQVRVRSAEEVWKLDPGEIGGLRAQSFEQALALIDRALDEPDCCAEQARAFTDRYITGVDGRTRERITGYLRAWMAETPR